VQPNNTAVQVLAPNNLIGGTVAGARNIIAGASFGVQLNGPDAINNLVQGNFIGTSVTGVSALGNTDGVVVTAGANHNTVGGKIAAARNVIAGSFRFGIRVTGPGTTANVFQGNFVGVAADGTTALGNASHGVFITDQAASNTIGGTAAGTGNVIANSGRDGVLIGSDPDHPGTAFTSLAGVGNVVLGNRIFSNPGQGIDLGPDDGINSNDAGDGDTGPNGLQNSPSLTLAMSAPGATIIKGTLDTIGAQIYRIEFFADLPGGSGQGRTFLGAIEVFQSSFAVFKFSATFGVALPAGTTVTATATGPEGTSEFSAFVLVV
jgi:titin